MAEIMEILTRIFGIVERIGQAETLSTVMKGIFGILLVFGVLNCILGYRLLRFWVMIFGFGAGAFAGLFLVRSMEVEDKTIYLGVMLGIGIVLGIISFLVYKVGIFILGAGIALTLSIYVLHPTTSAVFFACILCGVIVGTLGVRFAKEVIIVGTSLLGGVLAGFALSKLGGLAEIPYGIALSAGFILLGLLVQFATNRADGEDEEETPQDSEKNEEKASYEEYEDSYDYEEEYLAEENAKDAKHTGRKRRRGNVPDVVLDKPDKNSQDR